MNRITLVGLLLVLLLGIGSASGQQTGVEENTVVDTEATDTTETPESVEQSVARPTEESPAGSATNNAAETFVPTEDISEDRSVSFPVDI